MTRREKQCRRILSTSLLNATVPSDEIGSSSDCASRTGTEKKLNDLVWVWSDLKKEKRLGGSWVEPLLIPEQIGRYVTVISRDISTNLDPLRWVISQDRGWPPLLYLELDETAKVKKTDNKLVGKLTSSGRSFTSFQMVHTHTHAHTHTRILRSLFCWTCGVLELTASAAPLPRGPRQSVTLCKLAGTGAPGCLVDLSLNKSSKIALSYLLGPASHIHSACSL